MRIYCSILIFSIAVAQHIENNEQNIHLGAKNISFLTQDTGKPTGEEKIAR